MMGIHTAVTASITYIHNGVTYTLSELSNPPISNIILHRAESKGADISFRIIDADTGWNAGTQCPVPGDKIKLSVGYSTIFYGYVSEVIPSEDGYFTISAVDLVILMSKMGRSVYRNIYSSSRVETHSSGSYDSSTDAFVVSLPSADHRVTDVGDVTFYANHLEVYAGSQSDNKLYLNVGTSVTFTWAEHPFDYFRGFSFTAFEVSYTPLSYSLSVEVYVNDVLRSTTTWSGKTGNRTFLVDVGTPIYAKNKLIKIVITKTKGSDTTDDNLYILYASSNTINNYVSSTLTHENVYNAVISAHTYGYVSRPVTSGYQTGSSYYITGVEDVTIGSDALDTTFDGAMSSVTFPDRIIVYSTYGTISAISAMQQVLDSVGIKYSFGSTPSMQDIAEFRMAGGNIADYIWTLMDMKVSSESNGMSMYASGYNSLSFATRLNKSNTATYAIVSGEDVGASSLTELKIVSASPNISMINRYPTYLAKGTENETTGEGSVSNPLMVAVYDSDSLSQIGMALEGISSDSSNSTASACASSALSDVLSGRASEWSGSFTVSGIHINMISRASANIGSGVPVRLYYSRLGLSNYPATVREVTLDFDAQTTTLILNNYSQRYVNLVSDSASMSVTAATYAINAATETSFTTQYVLIRSSFSHNSSGNTMTLRLSNGATATVNAQVFVFPELGTKTITATWDSSTAYDNSNAHGAYQVRVNSGSYVTIPSAVRPDKKKGQTLIINMVAST